MTYDDIPSLLLEVGAVVVGAVLAWYVCTRLLWPGLRVVYHVSARGTRVIGRLLLRRWGYVLVALMMGGFSYWIWPTPYRYFTLENGGLYADFATHREGDAWDALHGTVIAR